MHAQLIGLAKVCVNNMHAYKQALVLPHLKYTSPSHSTSPKSHSTSPSPIPPVPSPIPPVPSPIPPVQVPFHQSKSHTTSPSPIPPVQVPFYQSKPHSQHIVARQVIRNYLVFPGHLRFTSQQIFLWGCVVKFVNGFGMRLLNISEGDPVITNTTKE